MAVKEKLPKITKPLLFISIGIVFGAIVTAIFIANYGLPSKIASLVNFKSSPSPQTQNTLTDGQLSPEGQWKYNAEKDYWSPVEPSEKALKIAAWGITTASDDIVKEAKKNRGDENMSNADLIRKFALEIDADPALLAEKEALMNSNIAKNNRPIVNVQPPNVNVESPDNLKHCTSSDIGRFTYTDCY